MCVAPKHGLFTVSCADRLFMHSLADGSLVRSVGSFGSGKGQFNISSGYGGLCVSPDGDSVLVAEQSNHRVQQVRIVDGAWVRFVGEGVLKAPQYVDCNADAIAVSETTLHRISVLSWTDGSVRAQFGSMGSDPGQLHWPCGVRLLADGSGLVVADPRENQLCVFATSGEFVRSVGTEETGLYYPCDVLQCASDGSFIVANTLRHNLMKVSRDGSELKVYGENDNGGCEFIDPTALAALSGGRMVVGDHRGTRFSIIRDQCHRLQWMGVCVSAALM
jgi:hypothetical protein